MCHFIKVRSHIIKPSEDYCIVSFLQLLTFARFRIHKLTVHFSPSPHWPPAGAAEPREDCSSGAGEGALAAGGPVREGAAGKGEPAHCGTGSAASSSSWGKSELANGCSRRTHAGPRRSSGRTESCRKRADAVHEPGTSPWPLGLLFAFTLQGKFCVLGTDLFQQREYYCCFLLASTLSRLIKHRRPRADVAE